MSETKVKIRTIRFPYAVDETGQGFYWPEMDQKRSEWLSTKRNRPIVAESVYQCNPGARSGAIFLETDFTYYVAPAGLAGGMSSPEVQKLCAGGAMVVQAWDTAFSADELADYTVSVTGLLVPSESYHRGEDAVASLIGPCEPHYRVYILEVFREHLDFADLVPAVRAQYHKWRPSCVIIEKKASGAPLISSLANTGINIEPVTPVEGKRARAVEGIGAGSVQGWFRQHRVLLPIGGDTDVWVEPFKRELKDFSGEKGGKDDQVDAAVHLVQYAISQGVSTVKMPTDWDSPEAVDRNMHSSPSAGFLDGFMGLGVREVFDPFEGTCGRCSNRVKETSRCKLHGIPVSELHGCDDFSSLRDRNV